MFSCAVILACYVREGSGNYVPVGHNVCALN